MNHRNINMSFIELVFLFSVKAEPHECVNRTDLLKTWVKAENEVRVYSEVTVSSCAITSV